MNHNLASQLREGTKQSHRLAENTAYMQSFVKGELKQSAFRQFLANLYFVYDALEAELLKHRHHIAIGLLYFTQLNRKANIEEDLAFYYGENWKAKIVPSKATKNYLSRLQQIPTTEAILLVAHAYVRYLGDLSGGQALKNIVRTSLNLPAGLGTRFYEFDAFDSIAAIQIFKQQYRNTLNSLPIEQELAIAIVDEANYAFQLNRDLLDSLKPAVTGEKVTGGKLY